MGVAALSGARTLVTRVDAPGRGPPLRPLSLRRRDRTWRTSQRPDSGYDLCLDGLSLLTARDESGHRGARSLVAVGTTSLPGGEVGARVDVLGTQTPVSISLRLRLERRIGGGEVVAAAPIRPGVCGRRRRELSGPPRYDLLPRGLTPLSSQRRDLRLDLCCYDL